MTNPKRLLTRDIDPSHPRLREIDLLRFFPIVIVMLYHLCFDISSLPDVLSNYKEVIVSYPNLDAFVTFCTNIFYTPELMEDVAPLVGGIFIFICGISTVFTHAPWRRGLLLTLAALLVSLFTWLLTYLLARYGIEYDLFIGWGVIHLMAISVLLDCLLNSLSKALFHQPLSPLFLFLFGLAVLLVGIGLQQGIYLQGVLVRWPEKYVGGDLLTRLKSDPWTLLYSALGKEGNEVDFWPIFPYLGVYFIGHAFGKMAYKTRQPLFPKLNAWKAIRPLALVGKHTIWFYLLHQPVYILVLAAILLPMGFRV